MWTAENWKDYRVLDTSDGEKLEELRRVIIKARPSGDLAV